MEPLECVMLDPVGLLLLPADSPQYGSDHHHISIPQKLVRRMMLSDVWQRYLRGSVPSLDDAAMALAELPFVQRTMGAHDADIGALAKTLAHCISFTRTHLRELPAMGKLLDNLREQLNVRLVSMSNATREEFGVLQNRFATLFARFDAIVISGEEGVGKSSQRFMQVALQKAGIQHARHSLYLDANDMQSILAARSVGIHATLIQPHQLIAHIGPSANRPNINLEDLLNLPATLTPPPQRTLITTNSLQELLNLRANYIGEAAANSKASSPNLSESTCSESPIPMSNNNNGQKQPMCPIFRAYQFPSLTSDGFRIWDNFAQFLMADVLNDPRFLPMQSCPPSGLLCFVDKRDSFLVKVGTMGIAYRGQSPEGHPISRLPMLDASTFQDIPEDLDTTSIGLSVLYKFGMVSMETINKVLDKMLKYVSGDDGILQVYFDSERPRIDPVVVANALYLFHLANRGQEVEASERFVQSVLLHRAYEDGTLYYNLGEAFLLHVARLVHRFKEHFTRSGMRGLLLARLQQHRASARWQRRARQDALALVMLMRACSLCGVEEEEDTDMSKKERQELVCLQREDGWWNCHAYYRYGGNLQSWIGNEGLTTAYALDALARAL